MELKKIGIYINRNSISKNLILKFSEISANCELQIVHDGRIGKTSLLTHFFEDKNINPNLYFQTKFDFNNLDILILCTDPESAKKLILNKNFSQKKTMIFDLSRGFNLAEWFNYKLNEEFMVGNESNVNITVPYPIASAAFILFLPLLKQIIKIDSIQVIIGKNYFYQFYSLQRNSNVNFDKHNSDQFIVNEIKEMIYRLKLKDISSKATDNFESKIHFEYLDDLDDLYLSAIIHVDTNIQSVLSIYNDFLNRKLKEKKSTHPWMNDFGSNISIKSQKINEYHLVTVQIKNCQDFLIGNLMNQLF